MLSTGLKLLMVVAIVHASNIRIEILVKKENTHQFDVMFMTSSTNINEVMTFISDRVPAGADAILDVQRSPCSVNRTDKEKLWQLQYPDDKKCSRIFVFITPYETYEKPNGELVSRHWAIIHNLNAMQQEQIKSVWTEAEKEKWLGKRVTGTLSIAKNVMDDQIDPISVTNLDLKALEEIWPNDSFLRLYQVNQEKFVQFTKKPEGTGKSD